MARFQQVVLSSLFIVITFMVTACGGSGGGGNNPTPTSSWTKQMGASAYTATLAGATATDVDGNIYVAGSTDGNLDGNTLSSTNAIDFFLTKYDASGTKVYTRQMGAGTDTQANATATDADGNVYVAGSTNGGLDGNTLSSTNATDFFLTKYDAAGTRVYTRQMGAGTDTFAHSIATDANGNVYVAGSTNGGLDGNTLSGSQDFFLTKYDTTGNKIYTRQMGVSGVLGIVYANSAATDADGNVYVAGVTFGGLDGNTSSGGIDFFLTKYDATGVKLYTKQMGAGASMDTQATSTATDTDGNVYVAGFTFGGLDGNTLTGSKDFFLTKYDATGVKLYTKQLGAAGASTSGTSTATDANGNVYFAGYTNGGLDGNALSGSQDFFLTKYDATGVKLYTKQMGAGANTITLGTATATDTSDNVYVAGYVYGSSTENLDGNTLSGTGASDFFLVKYNSAGVKQ